MIGSYIIAVLGYSLAIMMFMVLPLMAVAYVTGVSMPPLTGRHFKGGAYLMVASILVATFTRWASGV